MADYNITIAFEAIEDELISSMLRNLSRHRAEEKEVGYNWEQWQVSQLKALEEYRNNNKKIFPKRFDKLNTQIKEALENSYNKGGTEQEQKILKAIKKGYTGVDKNQSSNNISTISTEGNFFKVNDNKLDALIKSTTHDMEKAEIAVLRRANDQYRKIIYNAQVYANTGAGTYEKAVDMATKDFLSAGINSIEYKNGSRHTISDYANMAIQTANKRAYLQGEGEKRKEWGVSTVIFNKRSNPCPLCALFVGKVFIDDVWSGGSKDGISNVTGLKYPLLSEAIKAGLYHPNCRDVHTTYFEGISTPPQDSQYTVEELDAMAEQYKNQQKKGHCERQADKYERLKTYSLDDDNKKQYEVKEKEWRKKADNYNDFENSIERIEKDDIIKSDKLQSNTSPYIPITQDVIDNVPTLEVFDDEELNIKYRQANKDLLTEASKYDVGTEISAVYDANMNQIGTYTIGTKGNTKIDSPSIPYHAFHNHPSNKTFSIEDLIGFCDSDKMLSLTAKGNGDNCYIIWSKSNSDKEGFKNFLLGIINTPIFGNYTYKDIRNMDLKSMEESMRVELRTAIEQLAEKCIMGGANYGFKYTTT